MKDLALGKIAYCLANFCEKEAAKFRVFEDVLSGGTEPKDQIAVGCDQGFIHSYFTFSHFVAYNDGA
jgi:hypothetical protein